MHTDLISFLVLRWILFYRSLRSAVWWCGFPSFSQAVFSRGWEHSGKW